MDIPLNPQPSLSGQDSEDKVIASTSHKKFMDSLYFSEDSCVETSQLIERYRASAINQLNWYQKQQSWSSQFQELDPLNKSSQSSENQLPLWSKCKKNQAENFECLKNLLSQYRHQISTIANTHKLSIQQFNDRKMELQKQNQSLEYALKQEKKSSEFWRSKYKEISLEVETLKTNQQRLTQHQVSEKVLERERSENQLLLNRYSKQIIQLKTKLSEYSEINQLLKQQLKQQIKQQQSKQMSNSWQSQESLLDSLSSLKSKYEESEQKLLCQISQYTETISKKTNYIHSLENKIECLIGQFVKYEQQVVRQKVILSQKIQTLENQLTKSSKQANNRIKEHSHRQSEIKQLKRQVERLKTHNSTIAAQQISKDCELSTLKNKMMVIEKDASNQLEQAKTTIQQYKKQKQDLENTLWALQRKQKIKKSIVAKQRKQIQKLNKLMKNIEYPH